VRCSINVSVCIQFWHSAEVGVGVEVGRKGILFNGGCPCHIPRDSLYHPPDNFCTYYIIRGIHLGDNLFRDTGTTGHVPHGARKNKEKNRQQETDKTVLTIAKALIKTTNFTGTTKQLFPLSKSYRRHRAGIGLVVILVVTCQC